MCVREVINLTSAEDYEDNIKNKKLIITLIFVLGLLCIIDIFIFMYNFHIISADIIGYHSETKAFDVGNMRCDYYIEYDGCKVINVTKTDFCIGLRR